MSASMRTDLECAMSCILSDAAVAEYHTRGFYLARGLYDRDEIDLLLPLPGK